MPKVDIKINNQVWSFWESVTISRSIDSYSTISFSGPFDHSRAEFRSAMRPFSFQKCVVSVDGENLFSGTMLTPVPRSEPDGVAVDVSAYALPAVLHDTHMHPSFMPFEWRRMTLLQIAQNICGTFGIEAVADVDTGPSFKQVKLAVDKPPGDFLAELSKQRGRVLRDTVDGRLLITKSVTKSKPVARLVDGDPPVRSVSAAFSPQDYYSELSCFAKSKPGRLGARKTVDNPHLFAVSRPFSFSASDADRGDLENAANAKMGRMFGNMVAFRVPVATWHDESGALWEPNTIVTLTAPGSMVYSAYDMLVRRVEFRQDDAGESATLEVVIPGAFAGEIPERLPWD